MSLTGRLAFTGAAAAALIVLGTLAAFAAVESGHQAHGPVERIPGAGRHDLEALEAELGDNAFVARLVDRRLEELARQPAPAPGSPSGS